MPPQSPSSSSVGPPAGPSPIAPSCGGVTCTCLLDPVRPAPVYCLIGRGIRPPPPAILSVMSSNRLPQIPHCSGEPLPGSSLNPVHVVQVYQDQKGRWTRPPPNIFCVAFPLCMSHCRHRDGRRDKAARALRRPPPLAFDYPSITSDLSTACGRAVDLLASSAFPVCCRCASLVTSL